MTSDIHEAGEPKSSAPARPKTVSFGENLINSPSVKLIIISVVTMLLLIPSTFVWILVDDAPTGRGKSPGKSKGPGAEARKSTGPISWFPFQRP
ncbi:hypothetical protein [Roseibium aggregatum]|uniref:Uncharacterized protein n=1 Tax=Roseibium aggregatum TaxID=187304 RepID=A0A926S8E4_9HYPH|nr:hypothetical protein [Roseibium aggregatum]MBD1549786.1 hypothetical protein [Roseibium aggregatum]